MSGRCTLLGFAVFLVFVLTASGCDRSTHPSAAARSPTFLGTPAQSGAPAVDFVLLDQQGRLVRLSAQRGRVVLLTFLYTHCVDVCPLIAQNLNEVLDTLRRHGHAGGVRVLAVSVDPARDTSRAARAYVREHRLDSDFHYLLGSRTQLEPVLQAYNVLAVARNPELVDHSAFVLLIDRRGEPKLFYPPTVQADTILHDLLIGVLGGAADAH